MDDTTGSMLIGEQGYGHVLFSEDDTPVIQYDMSTEEIVPEPSDEAIIGEADESQANAAEALATMKRLIITANAMEVDGEPVYLDEEEGREKFDKMRLRLTNEQIDALRKQGYSELVYELEDAKLTLPMEALTPEIDVSSLQVQPTPAEGTEPEELVDVTLEPVLQPVSMYELYVEQVDPAELTDRETAALDGMELACRLYRVDVNAIGKTPEAQPAEGDASGVEGAEPVEPARYPVLKVFNAQQSAVDDAGAVDPAADPSEDQAIDLADAQAALSESAPTDWSRGKAMLRVASDYSPEEMPEGAKELFVASDPAVEVNAVMFTEPTVIETDMNNYAEFYPTASGLCAIVVSEEDEEDEEWTEEDDEDEDYEDEEAEAVEEEISEQTTSLEPAAETYLYAFSRDGESGKMYWLINTEENTVEYYCETAKGGVYQIGDYGKNETLLDGLNVVYRDNQEKVSIKMMPKSSSNAILRRGDDMQPLLLESIDAEELNNKLGSVRG